MDIVPSVPLYSICIMVWLIWLYRKLCTHLCEEPKNNPFVKKIKELKSRLDRRIHKIKKKKRVQFPPPPPVFHKMRTKTGILWNIQYSNMIFYCVSILQSIPHPDHFYSGFTEFVSIDSAETSRLHKCKPNLNNMYPLQGWRKLCNIAQRKLTVHRMLVIRELLKHTRCNCWTVVVPQQPGGYRPVNTARYRASKE